MRHESGFTLLEVMVALAIFAVVAASVLGASSRSLQTAARLQDKTLAMWVADNHLSALQLSQTPVAEGREQGVEQMAGQRWQWQSEVVATSEPQMRRVTLWVAPYAPELGELRERAAVVLTGFVGEPK